MNRKGKLTTKGKHAVILTLTIVACVAAMLFFPVTFRAV